MHVLAPSCGAVDTRGWVGETVVGGSGVSGGGAGTLEVLNSTATQPFNGGAAGIGGSTRPGT